MFFPHGLSSSETPETDPQSPKSNVMDLEPPPSVDNIASETSVRRTHWKKFLDGV